MSEMPKRIFAWQHSDDARNVRRWSANPAARMGLPSTEYVHIDEVQALIAGAFEAAARQCWPQAKRRAEQVHSAAEGGVQRARGFAVRIRADELVKAIEALTPTDAIAARDKLIADAVEAVAEHWFQGVTGKRQLLPEAQAEIRAIAASIRKRGEGQP